MSGKMSGKLFDKANDALKKRNYDYAIELYLQELTRNPDNADARRALRAAEMKKLQEAGKPFDGGLAYVKGFGSMMSAAVLRATKSYEKAMLACEQFLKHAPRNKSMLRSLGDLARLAGHNQAAKVAFEELLDADRQSEPAMRALAQIYREEEDLGRSLDFYERLKQVNPADPEAAKAVRDLAAASASRKVDDRRATGDGSFRDLMKDTDQAQKLESAQKRVRTGADADGKIEALEQELDGTPEDARRLKQIGELHLTKKQWDKAVDAYERALKARKDPQIEDLLGDARLKRLDHDIQEVQTAQKRGDKNAKERRKQLEAERLELGIAEYDRRVKQRPTELGLRFQLGAQLYKAKRYDDAISHLQKAAGDARRGAQARLVLGKCFSHKGLHDLAVKELRKAREQSPGMDEMGKEVTYELALVLEHAGKKAEAAEELEKVVEADIEYRDAMKRLEALKQT